MTGILINRIKKQKLVCEDDGENLSIENGDLELLLGGMDLSGYDNTISVGQLKTRPDQVSGGSA